MLISTRHFPQVENRDTPHGFIPGSRLIFTTQYPLSQDQYCFPLCNTGLVFHANQAPTWPSHCLNQSCPILTTFFCYHQSTGIGTALTHWGWVTHICVSKLTIIGSDNGLSPGRHQAIIWTNAGILLIGPLGTNFNRNSYIFIQENPFETVVWKMAAILSRPQCVNMATDWLTALLNTRKNSTRDFNSPEPWSDWLLLLDASELPDVLLAACMPWMRAVKPLTSFWRCCDIQFFRARQKNSRCSNNSRPRTWP